MQVIIWLAEQPDTNLNEEGQQLHQEAATTQHPEGGEPAGEKAQAEKAARLPPSPERTQQHGAEGAQVGDGTSNEAQQDLKARAVDVSLEQPPCQSESHSDKTHCTALSNGNAQATSEQRCAAASGSTAPKVTAGQKAGSRGTKIKTRPGGQCDKAHKPPGRNQPCPCGSRKKYKACCGAAAAAEARRRAAGAGDEGSDREGSVTQQVVVPAAQLEAIVL